MGVTFEQGRNEINLADDALFENRPTVNKDIPEAARRDFDGGADYSQIYAIELCVLCQGRTSHWYRSRAAKPYSLHQRLAGQKADIWWLRQHPKVMNLPFVEKIRRADRDNTIDIYISEDYDDVLADGAWQQFFTDVLSL